MLRDTAFLILLYFFSQYTFFFISVLPALSLDDLSLEQFRQIIDVNLLGAFLVSKVRAFH